MSVPIRVRDIRNQLPQAGRIRAGRKVKVKGRGGKEVTAPQKLRNFRFTSSDRRSIEQVAGLYGGEVVPWTDPLAAPGQFEVITEVNEINVALPTDPLSDTVYELWSGGGCQRRCDGEKVMMARGGGEDGSEPVEQDCICASKGELECKLTTRLSVIIPDIRFLGLWRLDTKGINAAKELPGMVANIQALQGQPGFTSAVLRLEQRTVRKEGQKPSQFVVPVLGLDNTPQELIDGQARFQAAAIDASASCPGCASIYSQHWLDCPNIGTNDDDVIDAEVVEPEPEVLALPEYAGAPEVRDPEMVHAWMDSLTTSQQGRVLIKARAVAMDWGVPEPSHFGEITVELADAVCGNGTP